MNMSVSLFNSMLFLSWALIKAEINLSYDSLVPYFEELFEQKAPKFVDGLSEKDVILFIESSKVDASNEKLLEAIKEPNGYNKTMLVADEILKEAGFSGAIIMFYHKMFLLMPRLGELLNKEKADALKTELKDVSQFYHAMTSEDKGTLKKADSEAMEAVEAFFRSVDSESPTSTLFQHLFDLLIREKYRPEFFRHVVQPVADLRLMN